MSDRSLPYRIAAGVVFFSVLAVIDLIKRGRDATRWREYAFLIACCLLAMVYGAANDQISSRISWEYFYYGKELGPVLGPQTPPDRGALSWEAAKIGMSATWSAGLIIGAVMLIANNPRKGRSPLPYRSLFAALAVILASAIVCSVALSAVGYFGGLTWISADFQEVSRTNLWRPRHFMATYGEHLGGYVGGLIGTVVACFFIVKRRKQVNRDVGQ